MVESKEPTVQTIAFDVNKVNPSIENLTEYFKGLNTCFTQFVAGLRSCYSEGDSSNQDYITLRGNITSDAILYSKKAIPTCKKCLLDAKDFLSDFGSIYSTPKQFLEDIDGISKEAGKIYQNFAQLTKVQGVFLKNAVVHSSVANDLLKSLEKSQSELKVRLAQLDEEVKKCQAHAGRLGFFGNFLMVIPIVGAVLHGVKMIADKETSEAKHSFEVTAASLKSDEQACLIMSKYLVPSLRDYESVLKGLTKIFELISSDAYDMSSKAEKTKERCAENEAKADRFLKAILPIAREAAQACGFCLQLMAVMEPELAGIEKYAMERKGTWIDAWKIKHAENEKMIQKELVEIIKNITFEAFIDAKKKAEAAKKKEEGKK